MAWTAEVRPGCCGQPPPVAATFFKARGAASSSSNPDCRRRVSEHGECVQNCNPRNTYSVMRHGVRKSCSLSLIGEFGIVLATASYNCRFAPSVVFRVQACYLSLYFLAGIALAQAPSGNFLRCGDLSFLDELETAGAVYRDAGTAGDALEILKSRGFNAVRLRIFHTPTELRDGLEDVLALARRARSLELGLVLDFHYSDTWADPGHQTKPTAWTTLSHAALRDSVKAYTQHVLAALKTQGTVPAIVQIGNEITGGFLWNDGRVGGAFDTPLQWKRLGELLQSATEGVREVVGDSSRIMIHIDRGGSPGAARWFFDHLIAEGVSFDLIGLSYYPWWHGPLEQFQATLNLLKAHYRAPVFLAETAYPWTLEWFDDRHNIVGLPEHVLPGYPATPQGQVAFLTTVVESLMRVAAQGACYWAPDYVATPGYGSPWENLALFDGQGDVLPAAAALGGTQLVQRTMEAVQIGVVEAFPNPASDIIRIRFDNPSGECVQIRVLDLIGRLRRTVPGGCMIGSAQIRMSMRGLSPGVYLFEIRAARSGVLARGKFVAAGDPGSSQ